MERTGDATSVDCEANASLRNRWPNSLDSREGGVRRISGGEGQFGCSEGVSMAIDPVMYGNLPKELLPLVFARLPLPQLLGLRRSALMGHWDIVLNDSEFIQLLAQNHSNLCAVVLKEPNCATFGIGVHSGESSSWEELKLSSRDPVNTMCSSDGGLVCFALAFQSEKVEDGVRGLWLVLAVVNPLTGDRRRLPAGHGLSPFQLKMMQLVMDRNTYCYQVIFAHGEGASRHEFPPFGALISASETGVWTKVMNSSQIFLGPTIHEADYILFPIPHGNQFNYKVYKMDNYGGRRGPSAYECAAGEVLYIDQIDKLVE